MVVLDRIICGDCLVELPGLPKYSIDAIVTDPPYELGFMGKKWDGTGIAYNVDLWRECRRVLKPGGYLLSFGGSRTYHRMACAIEDAGFEIRDCIEWVYGAGFPKSLSIDKAFDKDNESERVVSPEAIKWSGWGTALKPAHEPIVMARKPIEGRVIDNIRAWGCGGVNIDGCRISTSDDLCGGAYANNGKERYDGYENWRYKRDGGAGEYKQPSGRFPANLILGHSANCKRIGRKVVGNGKYTIGGTPRKTDGFVCTGSPDRSTAIMNYGHEEIDDWLCEDGCPVKLMGEQSGISKTSPHRCKKTNGDAGIFNNSINEAFTNLNDFGTAARFFLNIDPDPFFYCAKASRSERGDGNNHPTVKPLSLMRYLCRLITPPGGVVLDPFAGSGTTGMAAKAEGFRFIGIEKEAEYAEIARRRIAAIPTGINRWEEDVRQ